MAPFRRAFPDTGPQKREARGHFVEAIRAGRFLSKTREFEEDKNYLLSRRVSEETAAAIVACTRGHQANSGPHHQDEQIEVWVFKPVYRSRRGVKGYLVEDELRLISFHPAEVPE